MPPVKVGLAAATGDIIAVMDDDAEAEDGWAARMLDNYAALPSAPSAAAASTRRTKTDRRPFPTRTGSATSTASGSSSAACTAGPRSASPVEVDFLMGGNMSFRREVAARLEFDMELNRNVAQGYEVDIGLQVRGMGLEGPLRSSAGDSTLLRAARDRRPADA